MQQIYTTQDYLRIELYFEEDIAESIASAKIKYVDPDGTAGSWNASVDTINKKIYYDLPPGSPLGVAGTWTVWSYLTMTDGRFLPGTKSQFKVSEEIPSTTSNCFTGNCY